MFELRKKNTFFHLQLLFFAINYVIIMLDKEGLLIIAKDISFLPLEVTINIGGEIHKLPIFAFYVILHILHFPSLHGYYHVSLPQILLKQLHKLFTHLFLSLQ